MIMLCITKVMYAVTVQIELDMTQSPWACFKQLLYTNIERTRNLSRIYLYLTLADVPAPCFRNQTARTPHMTNVIM